MGRMPWCVYLWPGLPHVWRRGAWSGLAVAVGFAVMLNLALASSLVWTELELPAAGSRNGYLWLAIVVVWIGAGVFSLGWQRHQAGRDDGAAEREAFREALNYYLQQNWYEAERSLAGLLRRSPRDLDARMLLAGVLRRTDRLDEAAGELDRLSRMEGSRKWELEIAEERRRLGEALSPEERHEDAVDDEKAAA
jgi:hypothetical protein